MYRRIDLSLVRRVKEIWELKDELSLFGIEGIYAEIPLVGTGVALRGSLSEGVAHGRRMTSLKATDLVSYGLTRRGRDGVDAWMPVLLSRIYFERRRLSPSSLARDPT